MTLDQLWPLHFACHIRMSHAKSIHFLSIIYLSGSTRQLDRRLLLRVLASLYIADSCIAAEITYKLILRTWKWNHMWCFSMFHFHLWDSFPYWNSICNANFCLFSPSTFGCRISPDFEISERRDDIFSVIFIVSFFAFRSPSQPYAAWIYARLVCDHI